MSCRWPRKRPSCTGPSSRSWRLSPRFCGYEIRKIVGDEIPVVVREGSVYREILKEAHAIKADLIVLASAKGDFPDYPFGPNAARVVRHANCSVLVHRG
jgi:nucleotide-binding universal stress UspA family protein